MLVERCGESFAHPVGSAQREVLFLLVVDINGTGISFRELNRLGDDRGKDGFQFERRVDGLADLAERGELAGADLDLVF